MDNAQRETYRNAAVALIEEASKATLQLEDEIWNASDLKWQRTTWTISNFVAAAQVYATLAASPE